MKVAVAAKRPEIDARVETKLGTCAWLLLVETETMDCEALAANAENAGWGAGAATTALIIAHQAEAVIAGFVSPRFAERFRENGIDVVTGVRGTVEEAVRNYLGGQPREAPADAAGARKLHGAVARSARQFASLLPVLLGVVLLVGLFKAFLTGKAIAGLFAGPGPTDALLGATLGSVFAGNPVNSYVIGDALLSAGTGPFAVAALILTWVSVGLVQLPAEVSALGARFAVGRAVAAFLVSVAAAVLAALLSGASL
jgi:predicted Fe-Mo cluster-binding NifX family protein